MERKITLEEEMETYRMQSAFNLKEKSPAFVIIDGKSMKAFFKELRKPYDGVFMKAMYDTMQTLCGQIQGCVFGYNACDQIVLVLTDYHRWNSTPWLGYDVQKVVSAAAALTTEIFKKKFDSAVNNFKVTYDKEDREDRLMHYEKAKEIDCIFMATAMTVPEERVCEMIYWIQRDNRRKAIQNAARMYFDRKALLGKCNDEVIKMLSEKGLDWNQLPTIYRHGAACKKTDIQSSEKKGKWIVDKNMPMLGGANKYYLQRIMNAVRDPNDYE